MSWMKKSNPTADKPVCRKPPDPPTPSSQTSRLWTASTTDSSTASRWFDKASRPPRPAAASPTSCPASSIAPRTNSDKRVEPPQLKPGRKAGTPRPPVPQTRAPKAGRSPRPRASAVPPSSSGSATAARQSKGPPGARQSSRGWRELRPPRRRPGTPATGRPIVFQRHHPPVETDQHRRDGQVIDRTQLFPAQKNGLGLAEAKSDGDGGILPRIAECHAGPIYPTAAAGFINTLRRLRIACRIRCSFSTSARRT